MHESIPVDQLDRNLHNLIKLRSSKHIWSTNIGLFYPMKDKQKCPSNSFSNSAGQASTLLELSLDLDLPRTFLDQVRSFVASQSSRGTGF